MAGVMEAKDPAPVLSREDHTHTHTHTHTHMLTCVKGLGYCRLLFIMLFSGVQSLQYVFIFVDFLEC